MKHSLDVDEDSVFVVGSYRLLGNFDLTLLQVNDDLKVEFHFFEARETFARADGHRLFFSS